MNPDVGATVRSFAVRRPRDPARRRGVAFVYLVACFAVLLGFCSLAIDFGHAELVKTELQRAADGVAHDYISLYNTGGTTLANTDGPLSESTTRNPVDIGNGTTPTYSVTWGYWNSASQTFSGSGTVVAVKVVASCTTANGNAVPMLFASVFGFKNLNVSATAIAASVSYTTSVSVSALSNPYFAGMPSTTTNYYGDNMTTDAPDQVSGIPVTPGEVLTFTNFTGTVSVVPGTMPYAGPAGVSGYPYGTAISHNQNWDGTYPDGPSAPENGIGDAIMPESSLMGVFLNSNAPTATATPAEVDWTQSSINNKAVYSNLSLNEPVYIGNGKTTGGTVKQFVVPPGATRFFIGAWDGVCYNNNGGSFSGSVNVLNTVQIVQ